MISLEHTLATILRQIEETRSVGDETALAELQNQRDAICRMLCALEQA